MFKILYIEQTTQDAVRHLGKSFSNKAEKTTTSLRRRSFFCFLSCIGYTKVVNIMSLLGTHHKKEPLVGKGSDEVTISALCSFSYILDMTVISQGVLEERMYKKCMFYTYAYTEKCSLYGKNMLLFK